MVLGCSASSRPSPQPDNKELRHRALHLDRFLRHHRQAQRMRRACPILPRLSRSIRVGPLTQVSQDQIRLAHLHWRLSSPRHQPSRVSLLVLAVPPRRSLALPHCNRRPRASPVSRLSSQLLHSVPLYLILCHLFRSQARRHHQLEDHPLQARASTLEQREESLSLLHHLPASLRLVH